MSHKLAGFDGGRACCCLQKKKKINSTPPQSGLPYASSTNKSTQLQPGKKQYMVGRNC